MVNSGRGNSVGGGNAQSFWAHARRTTAMSQQCVVGSPHSLELDRNSSDEDCGVTAVCW